MSRSKERRKDGRGRGKGITERSGKEGKVLRPTYPYQLPLSKATRYGRDFVPYCVSKKF